MAFEEGTEHKQCPVCGADHYLRWSRMLVREEATLKCMACPAVLYAGKTVRDYYMVRLPRTKR